MPHEGFKTTIWSVVLAAKDDESVVSRTALSALCETYWGPVYSYIRHKGYPTEGAKDLTQEFFTRFLEDDYLKDVYPEKGRFRSFLMACTNHFLSKERAKDQTQKRGGEFTRLQLDFEVAEERYLAGPSHDLSPEALLDAEWARTVSETALAQLENVKAGLEVQQVAV